MNIYVYSYSVESGQVNTPIDRGEPVSKLNMTYVKENNNGVLLLPNT